MRVMNKLLVAVASVGLCAAPAYFASAAPPAAAARPQGGLDLVVLIDNTLGQRVDFQLREVGDFLQTLPEGTRIEVAYADYGGIQYAQDFTTDREKAAKAIHIPSGFQNSTNGLYDSLTSLVKKWPETGNRRMVLLISDGIDTTDGVYDSEPNLNSVFKRALNQTEKSGVMVDTIYASGAGRDLRQGLLVLNGQGCLSKLAADTGGRAFFEGTETPVSFKPFLNTIARSLGVGQ
jgi:hypothetical protein